MEVQGWLDKIRKMDLDNIESLTKALIIFECEDIISYPSDEREIDIVEDVYKDFLKADVRLFSDTIVEGFEEYR